MEYLVYLIHSAYKGSDTVAISDTEYIKHTEKAIEQGLGKIYTLKEFEHAFNGTAVYSESQFIRIIKVSNNQ